MRRYWLSLHITRGPPKRGGGGGKGADFGGSHGFHENRRERIRPQLTGTK